MRRSQPILGTTADSKPFGVDVNRLISTRLLIQANSGGGKSWTLRRLLEETHGQIQQIVLDPEGEFASLRERFDYVLVGRGADFACEVAHAGTLARRLLELGASAVCDLFELKAPERQRFVRLFLEALINAPKKLWHPVLVVIDEAHDYAPEKREAEAMNAVIDLCTRGRKRGQCAVLATQRLSNLNKQAAAQCLNAMVGPTFLDIDRKRATEVLGVSRDQQRSMGSALMGLEPGEFYCVGRAFEPKALTLVKVGAVQTHHPEIAGGKVITPPPPPPPDRIRAALAKLADVPQEAEREEDERKALRTQVRVLRREVAEAKRQSGTVVAATQLREAERVYLLDRKQLDGMVSKLTTALQQVGEIAARVVVGVDTARPVVPAVRVETAPLCVEPESVDPDLNGLRRGARRMLEVLVRHHPVVMTRSQLATLSGLAPRSGTFSTYRGDLKRGGYMVEDGREVRVTEVGLAACGHVDTVPMGPDEVLEQWRGALRLGARKMLDVLVEIRPDGLTPEELAERTGYHISGTFSTYVGDLRRNGLVEKVEGRLRATHIVFGEMS